MCYLAVSCVELVHAVENVAVAVCLWHSDVSVIAVLDAHLGTRLLGLEQVVRQPAG